MATQEKTTNIAVKKDDTIGFHSEHSVISDCLLPPATELKAYQDVDTNIIPFIIKATDKEQSFRHKQFDRENFINVMGLIFAFIILVLGMGLSAFFIYLDKDITGTIFGGSTIIIALGIFVKRPNKNENNKKSKEIEIWNNKLQFFITKDTKALCANYELRIVMKELRIKKFKNLIFQPITLVAEHWK